MRTPWGQLGQLAWGWVLGLLAGALIAGCSAEVSDTAEVTDTAEVSDTDVVLAGPVPSVVGIRPATSASMPTVLALTPALTPVDQGLQGPPGASTEPVVMDQYALAFVPELLVVRVGQSVSFRNSEVTEHNVRLVAAETDETVFNADTPPGEQADHVFDGQGVYRVICDTHPFMGAAIVVVGTPWAAAADQEGRVELFDMPSGEYAVEVWTAETGWESRGLVDVGGEPPQIDLAGH